MASEGIPVNVTLCFSATQTLLAAKAGAWCVSLFICRLDDISSDGMELIEQILTIYENYDFSTQVLAPAWVIYSIWLKPLYWVIIFARCPIACFKNS